MLFSIEMDSKMPTSGAGCGKAVWGLRGCNVYFVMFPTCPTCQYVDFGQADGFRNAGMTLNELCGRPAARESWIDPLEFFDLLACIREKLLADRTFKNKVKILKQMLESQSSPGRKLHKKPTVLVASFCHSYGCRMNVLCPSCHAPIEWLQARHYLGIIKDVKLPAKIVKLTAISFRARWTLFEDFICIFRHWLKFSRGRNFKSVPRTEH